MTSTSDRLQTLQDQEIQINAAVEELRILVSDQVFAVLDSHGVVLQPGDEVELTLDALRKGGDGKGCIKICVGPPFAKVCWKNCDD